jgi:hypothetical protein
MTLLRPRERTIKVKAVGQPNSCNVTFTTDPKVMTAENKINGVGKPGYILYFDVVEDAGLDCVFHPDDPLWVEPIQQGQSACPSSPCSWDQFYKIDTINEGKTLMVRNKNDTVQLFAFTLRFKVAGCGNVLVCDPIWPNGNGSQK